MKHSLILIPVFLIIMLGSANAQSGEIGGIHPVSTLTEILSGEGEGWFRLKKVGMRRLLIYAITLLEKQQCDCNHIVKREFRLSCGMVEDNDES